MALVITTHRVPAPTMTIAVTPQGGIRSDNAYLLRERLVAVLAATRPERIVVDLSAVSDIDEGGVAALREGQDTVSAHGARLVVAEPDPQIREMLRRRGIGEVLEASVAA